MANQEKDSKTTKKSPRKESISERLESLDADPRRSQIGLLAENLASIEKALSRGIPRVVVWEGLREEGLTLSFLSFETYLQRLRKKRANSLATKTEVRSALQPTPTHSNQPKPGATQPVTPNAPKAGPNIPGEKYQLEKKQEAYKALKESIKGLSEREQRKILEEWRNQNSRF